MAAAVSRAAVMPLERAGGQAQFVEHQPPDAQGESLEPLLAWMSQSLGQPLTLSRLAKQAGLSTRPLSRRFREQTGTTPMQWVIQGRVRHAQHLLETTTMSIDRIAEEVGFRSSVSLREHFRPLVGTSPTLYRRAFGEAAA